MRFGDANQEKNQKFWYEKISSLDQKQLDMANRVHEEIEKNTKLFFDITNSQRKLEQNIQKELAEQFDKIGLRVENKLNFINEKVEERLKVGFEGIDTTFKQINEGIVKINEAQKIIENLSTQVGSLQNILTDKKSRGIFGEVQLNNILQSVFGEQNNLYTIQETLSNNTIVDATVKANMGKICIDSKFPLENFKKIDQDDKFKSDFKKDMKKHINDISQKYIIKNETAPIAVLFLPAEAIFAYLNAYETDIIDEARSKQVLIASPTTLMALLSMVLSVIRDIKMQEQTKKIQVELSKLSQNFERYNDRWTNLVKDIKKVSKDVEEIEISTNKIIGSFNKIENFHLE